MKRYLLVVLFGVVQFAGAFTARAQSTTRVAEVNPWFAADAAPVADETPAYPTGWMSAPGMSLNLHGRPSTDYWGRPLKQRASKRKTVASVEDAPTYPTGWMSAPGMSLNLHSRPTTDYWGRPLKAAPRRRAASSLSAAPAEAGAPVAVVLPRR